MGKGENAGNQHFLLFSQCFLTYQREKSSLEQHVICHLKMLSIWKSPEFIVWERVKPLHHNEMYCFTPIIALASGADQTQTTKCAV